MVLFDLIISMPHAIARDHPGVDGRDIPSGREETIPPRRQESCRPNVRKDENNTMPPALSDRFRIN
eukprot:4504723-Amphidinium_carterae.1